MTKTKNAELGSARCPLCGGTATARLSDKGLAYLIMNCCNAQLFTRSGDSDAHVRALILPAAPAPAPAPEPTAEERAARDNAAGAAALEHANRVNAATAGSIAGPALAPMQTPIAAQATAEGFGLLKGWFAK